jgi:hypothetical protein
MGSTFKYGIYIGATLIGYFLLINILGFSENIYLSFFNAIITGGCIFLAIRDVYNRKKGDFKYMDGFSAALLSGLAGTTIFTIFIAIYLFEIDPELTTAIGKQIAIANTGTEFSLLIFIFLSGVATTVVSALVILPIYKKSWNTREVRDDQKPMNN